MKTAWKYLGTKLKVYPTRRWVGNIVGEADGTISVHLKVTRGNKTWSEASYGWMDFDAALKHFTERHEEIVQILEGTEA